MSSIRNSKFYNASTVISSFGFRIKKVFSFPSIISVAEMSLVKLAYQFTIPSIKSQTKTCFFSFLDLITHFDKIAGDLIISSGQVLQDVSCPASVIQEYPAAFG